MSLTLRDIGYAVAHWVFGFKYFKIQAVMQYFFGPTATEVPAELKAKHDRTNKTFVVLNYGFPVVEGVFTFAANYCFILHKPAYHTLNYFAVVGRFGVGVLEVVSAFYLSYGVNRIRLLAKSGEGTNQIDVPQLIKHFLSFALYLISALIAYSFFANYFFRRTPESFDEYSYAISAANVISLIAQLLLVNILWPLTRNQPFKPVAGLSAAADEVIVVEEYDEDLDVTARIWQQLVRPASHSLTCSEY